LDAPLARDAVLRQLLRAMATAGQMETRRSPEIPAGMTYEEFSSAKGESSPKIL